MRASCGRRASLRRQAGSRARPVARQWCTAAGVGEEDDTDEKWCANIQLGRVTCVHRLARAPASAEGSGATVCCWSPAWNTACGVVTNTGSVGAPNEAVAWRRCGCGESSGGASGDADERRQPQPRPSHLEPAVYGQYLALAGHGGRSEGLWAAGLGWRGRMGSYSRRLNGSSPTKQPA